MGAYEISADELLDGKEGKATETKLERGRKLIRELLADKKEISIRELDEKAKEQGISGRNMRDVRSRMKNELEYQVNEKQYSLKRMMGGRVIEANTDFYRYLICHLPSIGA